MQISNAKSHENNCPALDHPPHGPTHWATFCKHKKLVSTTMRLKSNKFFAIFFRWQLQAATAFVNARRQFRTMHAHEPNETRKTSFNIIMVVVVLTTKSISHNYILCSRDTVPISRGPKHSAFDGKIKIVDAFVHSTHTHSLTHSVSTQPHSLAHSLSLRRATHTNSQCARKIKF